MNFARNLVSKIVISSSFSNSNISITGLNCINLCIINYKQFSSVAVMDKFKALIVNNTVPQIASNILQTRCKVVICKDEISDVLKNIAGIDGLFWASYGIRLDKRILDAAGPNLKAVATMSAGYDNIDIQELRKRGIKFGNTPGIVGSAVAEQAIMLSLAAARRLNEARIAIERSEWCDAFDVDWMAGVEISGSVVGIVGLGSIGQAIVKKLQGFEVGKFLYTGRKPKSEGEHLKCQFVPLEHLVKESDFIFSCLPLTKETTNIYDYDLFSKMKKNAVFVNVGRGGSVNQRDLVRALRENLIFAAGLDVMTPEPLDSNDELLKLHNCVLSPHLGTSTWKTTNDMAKLTATNILKALEGEPMLTPVV